VPAGPPRVVLAESGDAALLQQHELPSLQLPGPKARRPRQSGQPLPSRPPPGVSQPTRQPQPAPEAREVPAPQTPSKSEPPACLDEGRQPFHTPVLALCGDSQYKPRLGAF
jgi:hypothetical protein